MVDFHAHILPDMDDGPENVEMSLEMLRMSRAQGVDTVFSTSHFYAYEESPAEFIERRNEKYKLLQNEMAGRNEAFPEIVLGAEVLYFPGMCEAEEISLLKIGSTGCLLIEPPMMPWSDNMLHEIEQTGKNLNCIPVIAHIDRYIKHLGDKNLFDRVKGRRILVQVNTGFFLSNNTFQLAAKKLKSGEIHFLGSDCHDITVRPPNIGTAKRVISYGGAEEALDMLLKKNDYFFGDGI